MNHDVQSSLLLSLPIELRLSILELLIPRSSTAIRIAWSNKREHPNPSQPSIARTCRRLRADCLPIFYAQTHFTLHVSWQREHDPAPAPYLDHFAATPGFRNIQTICITTGPAPAMNDGPLVPTMEFAFDLKKGVLRMRSWKGKGERRQYEALSRKIDHVLQAYRHERTDDRLGLLQALIGTMERSSIGLMRYE